MSLEEILRKRERKQQERREKDPFLSLSSSKTGERDPRDTNSGRNSVRQRRLEVASLFLFPRAERVTVAADPKSIFEKVWRSDRERGIGEARERAEKIGRRQGPSEQA